MFWTILILQNGDEKTQKRAYDISAVHYQEMQASDKLFYRKPMKDYSFSIPFCNLQLMLIERK